VLPGGKIHCDVGLDYGSMKNNVSIRIETGEYQGLKYRIYHTDGSGSIQGLPGNTLDILGDQYGTNWSTRCVVDEMDDTAWCSISKSGVAAGIWKDGSKFI